MYVLIYSRCLSISSPSTRGREFCPSHHFQYKSRRALSLPGGAPSGVAKVYAGPLCDPTKDSREQEPSFAEAKERGTPPNVRKQHKQKPYHLKHIVRVSEHKRQPFMEEKTQQRQKTKTYELNIITLTRGPIH